MSERENRDLQTNRDTVRKKKKKRVSGPRQEQKHREDILKQIKMNRTCTLQQKEAGIPAHLGFSDHHPLYLGVPHIRLSLCKVLNPENEQKSIYCVLMYTRNIKNPGNAHVIFFHPFCNHYIDYVQEPMGKKNTALCSLKLYFQCCFWQQLLNSGSKFLPSAPHHSPDTHSFNSTSSGCLWSSLTVLKRQLSSGFQFLSCI